MVIVSNSRKLCAFAIHHVIPVIFVFEHHGATVPPGHSVTFTLQVGAGLVGAEVTLELGGKSPVIMCHSIARSHTHTIHENHFMAMIIFMDGLYLEDGFMIWRVHISMIFFTCFPSANEGRLP